MNESDEAALPFGPHFPRSLAVVIDKLDDRTRHNLDAEIAGGELAGFVSAQTS